MIDLFHTTFINKTLNPATTIINSDMVHSHNTLLMVLSSLIYTTFINLISQQLFITTTNNNRYITLLEYMVNRVVNLQILCDI